MKGNLKKKEKHSSLFTKVLLVQGTIEKATKYLLLLKHEDLLRICRDLRISVKDHAMEQIINGILQSLFPDNPEYNVQ